MSAEESRIGEWGRAQRVPAEDDDYDDADGWARVQPTAEDVRTLIQGVDYAMERLTLPPFVVEWIHPDAGSSLDAERYPAGFTYHRRNPVLVLLYAGRARTDLWKTVLHELRHVADADADLSVDQRELRAEAFAELHGYNWPVDGDEPAAPDFYLAGGVAPRW